MNLHSKTKFNLLLWEHLLELLLLMILLKLIKLTVILLDSMQISKKELKGINSQSSVLLNVPLTIMKSLELTSMLKNLKFVKLLFMLV